ncbi:MAG: hypothetical protein WKF86_03685 [Acidimicrobiales bacterium]
MMHRRRSALATVALAVAVLLGATATAEAAPPSAAVWPNAPAFPSTIDPLASYVGQTTCDPTAKPGALALRDLLEATYPVTTSLGIGRDCSIGGQSEHKEGRAYDWGVNAFDPYQKALADNFLGWLLAPDSYGNVNAMARRMGLMYVIWNRQVWKSYGTNRGWQAYTGANPHTDHVHFSLSWDGAYKRTSWYSPPTPVVPDIGVQFHPVNPARILDTRRAVRVGPYDTPWGPGQTRDVTVNGSRGVPYDAGAVVLNVTVTGPSAPGYLTIWPDEQPMPSSSSLNWASGETIPNAVTVRPGSGGRVSVFSSAGSAEVIFDVVGYYDTRAGDGFTSVTPARISDSRVGTSARPLGPGETRDVAVPGLPAGTDAIVANVTVTGTTEAGFLTIWPAGQARPEVSSLNWVPGRTIANSVTVKLGAGAKVSVFNPAGEVHVIVDLVGFFAPGIGRLFHPLPPTRIQDSRSGGPQIGPWAPDAVREVQVAGVGNVPTTALAVLSNVTATSTTASSFLRIWPAGQTEPTTSSLNWAAGQTIPNAVVTKPGANGRVSVRNSEGSADVIVDVAGWY